MIDRYKKGRWNEWSALFFLSFDDAINAPSEKLAGLAPIPFVFSCQT